jgi:farnesyl-diphosphate farnesyltransferase
MSAITQLYHIDELLYLINYKVYGKSKREWWKNVKYYSDLQKKDITFCFDILKDVSRSFSEVIKNLPQTLSLEIMTFYLMLRALDTVEDDITAFNSNKEERARYLKIFYKDFTPINNVGEPQYRPLIQNYDRVGNVFKLLNNNAQKIILDITKRMGEGMAEFVLSDYKIDTKADYNKYCNIVAGYVGEGLMKLSANANYETTELIDEILTYKNLDLNHGFGGLDKSMGLFLQKTNIIRDYKEDIEYDKAWWPKEIWYKYKKNFKDMGDDELSKNCLNEMILDALELVPDILTFHEKLTDNNIFQFCVIPQVMAIATLENCFDNSEVFDKNIKIRKGLALKMLESSKNIEDMYSWFHTFIVKIKKRIRYNDPNRDRLLEICDKILVIISKKYTPPLLSTNAKLVIFIALSLLISCIIAYYIIKILVGPIAISILTYFCFIHNHNNNLNNHDK